MKRVSLGLKMMVGGLLIVLVPLLIVGVFAIYKSSQAIENYAGTALVNVAKSTAEMVNTALKGEQKLIAGLAADEVMAEAALGRTEGASRKLEAMMKKIGQEYESIIVTDASGVVQADSVGGSNRGINVAERDYFQAAKAGKVVVGTPIKSKKTGLPVTVVAAPIQDASGSFVGAVLGVVKIDFLVDRIAATKVGKTGYAYMVDKKGLLIAHPKKENVLELNLTTVKGMEGAMAQVLSGKTGMVSYDFENVKRVVGFAPVETTGWVVGAAQNEAELLEVSRLIRNTIAVVTLIFLALTALAVFYFARSITGPISKATYRISEAASQVAAASGEVASSSQALAEGASEQASALEETSSSLEEMASMTKQNADNASQADSLMKQANVIVKRANESMDSLTRSMREISAASEETSKIIKTIDEIAFQTNLLALNAAVEAARAGEAGAGFAVVAEEVRNLAMRAAEAAKNTSVLIEDTVNKIREGSEAVTKTGEAFAEVSANAAKVGELVGEISAASAEQAQGIDQVNRAVAEMDKVTQQTAAHAEESASAAEEMNAQAMQMHQVAQELLTIIGGQGEGEVREALVAKGPAVRTAKVSAKVSGGKPARALPDKSGEFKDF
ncbi:MAG TPA: methyl-accepting chemotaxis protein [Syntrophales bacterium]|nr:methyl-accepting chemotaxis protein [Syntrophales bacterium]HPQ06685.1 methyl-accepting chemotaxis protein [Syntrophales bacterium]